MRRTQRVLVSVFATTLTASFASLIWSYDARRRGLAEGDLASVLGVTLALASLASGFWAVIAPRREADREQPLSMSVDALVRRIRQQWEVAEDLHRLNDDFALSVAWCSETAGLADDLTTVRKMAASWGTLLNAPPRTATPAEGDELAGEGSELAQILRERIPTGRLVILGEAGSGKTVLVERLLYGLLEQRSADDAVHVRIPLGSWPLDGPDLDTWMAKYLIGIEPDLKDLAPRRYGKRVRRADVLLREGLVVPVLDGFDELQITARREVLRKINSAMRARRPIILASRPEAYRAAVEMPGDTRAQLLSGAAGIELLPVTADRAETYLRQKGGDWDDLCRHLGTDDAVGVALRSPLTLFLCRTVYERTDHPAPPTASELCDARRFPDAVAIRSHLFASFIPAVYRETRAGRRPPWPVVKAERSLRFLARRRHDTESVLGSGADLTWWRLHHLAPRTRRRLAWTISLLIASLWLPTSLHQPTGIPIALYSSLFIIGIIQLFIRQVRLERTPKAGLGWHWRWVPIPAAIGAAMGFTMAETHVQAGDVEFGPVPYFLFSLLFALIGAAVCGWRPRKADLDRPVTPPFLLRQDRRTFLTYSLTWAFVVTVVFFSILAPSVWASLPLLDRVGYGAFLAALAQALLFTVVLGLGIGVGAAFHQTACGTFALACLWYGLRGRTPFRLLVFLDDAHHRGVLRQVGGSYEFRHVELQRHLAAVT